MAVSMESKMKEDFRVSLTNAPGKESYPIASFSWFYVPVHPRELKLRRCSQRVFDLGFMDLSRNRADAWRHSPCRRWFPKGAHEGFRTRVILGDRPAKKQSDFAT